MRYMTDTIVKYILENVNQTTGVFRYVFPSYPPELLFEIGRKLDEGFRRIKNFKVGMRYGIAYRLGQEWKDGDDKQRVYFDKIRQKAGIMRQIISQVSATLLNPKNMIL